MVASLQSISSDDGRRHTGSVTDSIQQHPAAPWWWCCWWVRAEQRTRRRRWRRQQLCRATRPEHAAQLTTFQPVRSLNWALLFCCVHSNLTSQEIRSAACKHWLLLLVVVDGLPQRLPSCRQPRRYSARGSDYFPHGFLSGGAPTDRPNDRPSHNTRTNRDRRDNSEVRSPPHAHTHTRTNPSMWRLPTVPSFSPSPSPLAPTRVRLGRDFKKFKML